MSSNYGKFGVGIAAIAFSLILAMPLSSISSVGAAQDDDESKESVLRIGFMQMVDSMNPLLGLIDASYVFYGMVYDNPHSLDENLEYTGNIAYQTTIVPVDDPDVAGRPYGSVWEYEITQNAWWHDGEPFTIDDFIWNIELHSLTENYNTVWAFQPYSYFIEKITREDDKTARIFYFDRNTEQPMACAFGDALGIPMLPRHKLLEMGVSAMAFDWNGVFEGDALPVVGTGPFKVTSSIYDEWVAGDRLTLVRNPDHHYKADKGKEVQFDRVEMLFYDDATSMSLALTSGDLDIAQFPPDTYKALKEDIAAGRAGDLQAYDGPKVTQYWTEIEFCMNLGGPNPSRLDQAIRQALAKATNKTYIVNNYYQGLADEGDCLLPDINTLWHYEPSESERLDYSLQEAADMLDDAGYLYPYVGANYRVCTSDSLAVKEGWVLEGKELRYEMLVRREYPEEKLIAKYLQETWAEIGVGLTYEVVDESTMGTIVYSYEYDTCIWYWSSDIDPNYMLYCQTQLAWFGWSDNKYYNPEYDLNYIASVGAIDYDERKEYVDNCQRIHYLDASWIIMAAPYQTYVWRTDTFEGWGDWDAKPGLSMDHFWSAAPLFFELKYIGDGGGGFDVVSAAITAGVVAAVVAIALLLWMRSKKVEKKRRGRGPLGE